MELLVVGLGNPGPRYALTRHNAGFIFLDYLAHGLDIQFQTKKNWDADYCVGTIPGKVGNEKVEHKVHLLKPQTFMNHSGHSVSDFLKNTNLSHEQIFVVHDEVEIPLGDVRLKMGGGDAGHNGLKSIREQIGSGEFYRLRVGVGRPSHPEMDLAAYVLQNFQKNEQQLLVQVLTACEEGLDIFLSEGLQKAQMRLAKI